MVSRFLHIVGLREKLLYSFDLNNSVKEKLEQAISFRSPVSCCRFRLCAAVPGFSNSKCFVVLKNPHRTGYRNFQTGSMNRSLPGGPCMQAAQNPVFKFAGLFNAIISPLKLKTLVVILAGSLVAGAQTARNLENGFKPFGSYDGTHFDTVNVMNGNLMVHIPLYPEAPQRGGKLDMQYLLYMTSKNWIEGCSPSPCRWQLLAAGPTLQRSWDVSLQSTMFIDSASGQTVYSSVVNKLVTGDGPAHLLYAIPGAVAANGQVTELETIDGTGYHVSLSNPDPSTGLLDDVVITGRDGTQYIGGSGGGGGCSGRPGSPVLNVGTFAGIIDNFPLENGMNCSKHGATAAMTDGNGNQIVLEPTTSYPGRTHPMGQTFSPWAPTPHPSSH